MTNNGNTIHIIEMRKIHKLPVHEDYKTIPNLILLSILLVRFFSTNSEKLESFTKFSTIKKSKIILLDKYMYEVY